MTILARRASICADEERRLVKDDFLMGRERADGKVYLVGGVIVFPGPFPLSSPPFVM